MGADEPQDLAPHESVVSQKTWSPPNKTLARRFLLCWRTLGDVPG